MSVLQGDLMKYCRQCLQPDTRPNTYFNDRGVCPACEYSSSLIDADWDERFDILKNIVKEYPRKPKQHFDCIIGVSGGKDSTRQALWIREKLGLRPLLVCLSYPPEMVTQCGVDNLSNLIELGFDTHVIGHSPATWKKIMRTGFFKFTNHLKGPELALFSAVPQVAIRYNIPLIFWGENPSLQLGDMKTLGKTGYDGNNLRYLNTLAGGNLDWMLNSGFTSEKIFPYQYPHPFEFHDNSIQIVYLGWFWKDWSLGNNGAHSCASGIRIREDSVDNTGDLRGITALDDDWVGLNQMIKYYKYGFGRVADYVNEEIRLGLISREDGITLCEKYDGACSDKYIQSFCQYIEITTDQFWSQVHAAVNPNLFEVRSGRDIVPRFKVGIGL